tara:strand:- start:57625 stop:58497 length:873 start_codon:yes stop_codon:yes gene_type:complete
MDALKPMNKETSINPVNNEKIIKFTGDGLLIGSLGSKEMKFTDNLGVEKNYRLATVKVNLPKIGEKNILLQVYEEDLKCTVGLGKDDEWESEDQKDDAISSFESGELYFTTVKPIKKNDGSGWTLIGNISHKLHDKFEKYIGVYRFTDYNMNGQEFFLIILKSKQALLLFEKLKERINLNNILEVYEQSYETYEQMVVDFETKPNESTLNRFVVTRYDNSSIELQSSYNQLFGFATYQCVILEAKFHQGRKDLKHPKLTLNSFSCHKNTINGEMTQKTKKLSDATFSKIL